MKISTFFVGADEYAFELSKILEILHVPAIRRVPGFEMFEGAITHRDHVIPLICLRKKLGLPGNIFDARTRILALKSRGTVVGVIVDAMGVIHEADINMISPPASLISAPDQSIRGIIRIRDKLVLLMDPDALLV